MNFCLLNARQICFGLSVFFFASCTPKSGNKPPVAATCTQPQNLNLAFEEAMDSAPLIQGSRQLLIRMIDLQEDFENFKSDLTAEFKAVSFKIQVNKINENTVAVDLPEEAPTSEVVSNYIKENKISYIEPDHLISVLSSTEISNAGPMPFEHSLPQKSFPVIKTSSIKRQVIVAVIDSGVDYTHKDLAPYMWKNPNEIPANQIDDDNNGFVDDVYGWDFANSDNDPMADDEGSYHGTHVAGIVQKIAYLAKQDIDVKIMALKFLNANGSGQTSHAVQAINYAVQNGALILNNSWGSSGFSSTLADAIENAREKQVLFVAAAGNGDSNGVGINIDKSGFYPAGYPHSNIISIAATDNVGQITGWSNYGPLKVDIAAPGKSILSTRNGNTYAYMSGTSMATPHVAGVAALLWSLRPDLSLTEIENIIYKTVQTHSSLLGKILTNGMISESAALNYTTSYVHDPNAITAPPVTNYNCIP